MPQPFASPGPDGFLGPSGPHRPARPASARRQRGLSGSSLFLPTAPPSSASGPLGLTRPRVPAGLIALPARRRLVGRWRLRGVFHANHREDAANAAPQSPRASPTLWFPVPAHLPVLLLPRSARILPHLVTHRPPSRYDGRRCLLTSVAICSIYRVVAPCMPEREDECNTAKRWRP